MTKGYVQIYTGNGKGKTTAALGLALRALGAGRQVFLGQFLKGRQVSEIRSLRRFAPELEMHQFGEPTFVLGKPAPLDLSRAREGWELSKQAITKGIFDLVILDEIIVAADLGMIALPDLIAVIQAKPAALELVLTGRNAPPELLQLADLVTEMAEVKHYYQTGVAARIGIEK